MATTVSTDVVLYDEQFQGGFVETLMQNVDGFNAASRGTITLQTQELLGSYEKEAFWDEVSSISRRDPTADSSSAATSVKLTQDEFIGVKLDRRNGPYESNIDSFRKIGLNPSREKSRIIGIQTAAAMPKEMLDRALAALEGKLDATAALEHDATAATIVTTDLVTGLSKFGDNANRVGMWVMHSKVFFDLVTDQLTSTANVFASDVWGAAVFDGTPATLGRPVLVVDSTSLVQTDGVSTGVDKYSTLGLVPGAAVLDISAPPVAVLEGPITGADNLYIRWQSEYSYNLKLRGCQWDVTNGGANPTDANVALATNWDTVAADNKSLPGVIVTSR